MAKKVNCTELEATIAEVALNLAARPEYPNIDAVAKAMQDEYGVRRDIMVDAIDAYSRGKARKELDAAKKQLAEIRNDAKAESALRKKVGRLEAELAGLDIDEPISPKTEKRANEVLQQLRQKRDTLQTEIALKNKIDDLTKQIDSRQPKPTAKRQFKDVSDEVTAMRAERNELQAQLRQVREINRLTEYLKKLVETKKMESKNKRVVELSNARKHNQAMLDRLRYDIRQVEENLKPKSWGEKAIDLAGVPRSIMSSTDLSAFGLQGWFSTVTHPIVSIQQLVKSIVAAFSHINAIKFNQSIVDDPMFLAYKDAGGYLAPIEGGSIASREEAFNSSLAENLPLLGRFIKASGRAYATFLNGVRFYTWKQLMKSVPSEMATADFAKQLAQFTNIATGRGQVGQKVAMAIPAANTIFFSIRNWLSRLQMLTLVPYKMLAPQAAGGYEMTSRKVIAREYAKFLAGTGLMLALLEAMGGIWEKDPRGSGFGKIRFGNTTIDLSAQLGAELHFLTKLVTKQRKTLGGDIMPLVSYKYGQDKMAEDVGVRKVRSKLSPMASYFWDYMAGKDFNGDPFEPVKGIYDRMIPLSVGEVIDAYKERHATEATLISMLNILGFRPDRYDPKEAKEKRRQQQRDWERRQRED